MSGPKYVAEGYEEDISRLLSEFVEECSVEFVDFQRIWKDNYFALVFMGRPDLTETSEFTNEVFRITSHFLYSPSYFQRIGAVFALYSLHISQIASPPVKVRIEMSHWNAVKDLYIDALSKKYKSLIYIINYLMREAFHYVAHQTLKGPLIGSMPRVSKNFEVISTMKSVYRSDFLEYSASNNLEAIKNLHSQYLNVKRNLAGDVNLPLNADTEVYQMFIKDVNRLVNPSVKAKEDTSGTVGERRAKIKAKSFLKKAKDRFGQVIEDDEDIDDPYEPRSSPEKKKNKRSPKKKGKVGRPRKKPEPEVEEEEPKSDDDIIDISHLLQQQNEFFLPPDEENKKLKSKPGRYYYKLSPKRDKEDED